jgi:hypothetical protein
VSAFVVAFLIAASATGAPREPLRAKGIFADPKGGRAVYVFVDVHRCSAEPSLPAAQILESLDDGKTWERTGPRLEGSEFQLAQASPEGVWVAGLHIAEGPGIDPFLLAPVVPADPRKPWVLHPITSGPSELVKVEKAGPRSLRAWIRRVDHADAIRNGPPRAAVVFSSDDGGRSWSAGRGAGSSAPGQFRKFAPITERSGAWRIVDRSDGGFDVRRREATGTWRTVGEFPWSPCDEPAASPLDKSK